MRVEAVADAATVAVEKAADIGGSIRFGNSKPYRLTGSVTKVSNRKDTSTVVVHGVPTGGWALKSNGRRGGYDVRARDGGPLDLRTVRSEDSGPVSVHISDPARGDGRWLEVVDAARAEFGDIVDGMIEGAIDG